MYAGKDILNDDERIERNLDLMVDALKGKSFKELAIDYVLSSVSCRRIVSEIINQLHEQKYHPATIYDSSIDTIKKMRIEPDLWIYRVESLRVHLQNQEEQDPLPKIEETPMARRIYRDGKLIIEQAAQV